MSRYKRICPWCGNICEGYEGNNLFCKCFAKFYWEDKVWLNRNTGEEIWESNGVEGNTIQIPRWTYKGDV